MDKKIDPNTFGDTKSSLTLKIITDFYINNINDRKYIKSILNKITSSKNKVLAVNGIGKISHQIRVDLCDFYKTEIISSINKITFNERKVATFLKNYCSATFKEIKLKHVNLLNDLKKKSRLKQQAYSKFLNIKDKLSLLLNDKQNLSINAKTECFRVLNKFYFMDKFSVLKLSFEIINDDLILTYQVKDKFIKFIFNDKITIDTNTYEFNKFI